MKMSTPVLFLDDASRHSGVVDRVQAERTAMTLLDTLKSLRKINKKFALNTAKPLAHYQIADDWTLQSILGGPSHRDDWDFIRFLNDRSPFSAGLKEGLLQEVDAMEFRTQAGRVPSSALAWATLLDAATVSFDAHVDWSRAWVDIEYTAIDDDGNISESAGRVRNASNPTHADEHVDWLKFLGLSASPSALEIWNERTERFIGLRFLSRTKDDFITLGGSGLPFVQALVALGTLAHDVESWKPASPWPEFSTKATPEHEQRRKFCWAMDDVTGKQELFDWHIRFNGGLAGRIHFRVDSTTRSIVVAYVGSKLMQEIPS